MRNFLFYMLLLSMVGACKKKDDNNNNNNNNSGATPKASFIASKLLIDSGETVTFTNNSENAVTYAWDLDGNKFFTKDVQKLYDKRGTYTAKLTAYNGDNTKSDDTVQTITVGSRYLVKFNFNKYKMKDGTGADWDNDGTGPDIFVRFGPESDPMKYQTSIHANADGSAFSISIDPAILINNSNNGSWIFRVMDDDNGTVTPMTTYGNTVKIYPSRGLNPGSNPVIIANDANYQVTMDYEIRP